MHDCPAFLSKLDAVAVDDGKIVGNVVCLKSVIEADGMYFAALQACELYENALSGLAGRHLEDAIYEVDASTAAEFDKNFPPKERVTGTPSQRRFQEALAMQRSAE